MDFAPSEEQRLLVDGAERFIREAYDFESRRALADSAEGYSPAHWGQFAELGWLALPIGEDRGGLGGSAADVMLLMEVFGRGLVLEPYLGTVLLAGRLIERLASPDQAETYLRPMLAGSSRAAFAFTEPQSRYDLADVATRALRDRAGYSLSGRKSLVLGGPGADSFVVCARTAGDQRERDGLSCFLVPAAAAGLTRYDYRTIDGGRASELYLEDVAVEPDALLGAEGAALPIVEEVVDGACAAVCAEAVGILDAASRATRDYLSQRTQFGAPLASFQALQHRLADMTIAVEELRSLAYVANMRLDEDDPAERGRAVSAAKAEIGRRGRSVVADAVQLHGGMGVSEELNIATYFKRLNAITALFGDRAFHLRRYRKLGE